MRRKCASITKVKQGVEPTVLSSPLSRVLSNTAVIVLSSSEQTTPSPTSDVSISNRHRSLKICSLVSSANLIHLLETNCAKENCRVITGQWSFGASPRRKEGMRDSSVDFLARQLHFVKSARDIRNSSRKTSL